MARRVVLHVGFAKLSLYLCITAGSHSTSSTCKKDRTPQKVATVILIA
jgi:hypothetical protein